MNALLKLDEDDILTKYSRTMLTSLILCNLHKNEWDSLYAMYARNNNDKNKADTINKVLNDSIQEYIHYHTGIIFDDELSALLTFSSILDYPEAEGLMSGANSLGRVLSKYCNSVGCFYETLPDYVTDLYANEYNDDSKPGVITYDMLSYMKGILSASSNDTNRSRFRHGQYTGFLSASPNDEPDFITAYCNASSVFENERILDFMVFLKYFLNEIHAINEDIENKDKRIMLKDVTAGKILAIIGRMMNINPATGGIVVTPMGSAIKDVLIDGKK